MLVCVMCLSVNKSCKCKFERASAGPKTHLFFRKFSGLVQGEYLSVVTLTGVLRQQSAWAAATATEADLFQKRVA